MFFLKTLPSEQILLRYKASYPHLQIGTLQSALIMLRHASLLIREIEAYFAGQSFSQLRFLILMVIDREASDLGLTATEVAAQLDVSKPVMTRTLRSLEAARLLIARAHDTDGRARRLHLTRAGKAKLAAVLPGYYTLVQEFMDRL